MLLATREDVESTVTFDEKGFHLRPPSVEYSVSAIFASSTGVTVNSAEPLNFPSEPLFVSKTVIEGFPGFVLSITTFASAAVIEETRLLPKSSLIVSIPLIQSAV